MDEAPCCFKSSQATHYSLGVKIKEPNLPGREAYFYFNFQSFIFEVKLFKSVSSGTEETGEDEVLPSATAQRPPAPLLSGQWPCDLICNLFYKESSIMLISGAKPGWWALSCRTWRPGGSQSSARNLGHLYALEYTCMHMNMYSHMHVCICIYIHAVICALKHVLLSICACLWSCAYRHSYAQVCDT